MFFSTEIPFDMQGARETLRRVPSRPAVFALRGETGEPYLNRTPDLRRRLERLLLPSAAQSRRLQLAAMVRTISWTETAGEFEAQLLLYRAASAAFGERAASRLHLRTPFFVRMGMRNRFPRAWVTNSLSTRALADLFGPFPSRAAAERYLESVLDLYLLRRCFQDLDPDPTFPGCIYSEMHKCMAPCYGGCTQQRYDEEAAAVHAFLSTRGAALLDALAAERDRASDALDFETAARTHTRYEKAEAVRALAPEAALALAAQNGAIVQPSAEADSVQLYLLRRGVLRGPVVCSVLGMRLPNEASGSSSLFAHPAQFAPVPLGAVGTSAPAPEDRVIQVLEELAEINAAATREELCAHQALLARWLFRPQQQRVGELVPAPAGAEAVPAKPLMRAVARVFVASLPRSQQTTAQP